MKRSARVRARKDQATSKQTKVACALLAVAKAFNDHGTNIHSAAENGNRNRARRLRSSSRVGDY